MSEFALAGRPVGNGLPCYVIAEAVGNHNGNMSRAIALIDAAAEAGADAVKFQTFQPELHASASVEKASYQKRAWLDCISDVMDASREISRMCSADSGRRSGSSWTSFAKEMLAAGPSGRKRSLAA